MPLGAGVASKPSCPGKDVHHAAIPTNVGSQETPPDTLPAQLIPHIAAALDPGRTPMPNVASASPHSVAFASISDPSTMPDATPEEVRDTALDPETSRADDARGHMVAVAVTRMDFSVADLRSAGKRATSIKQGLRLLAIAMVLDGHSREAAAEACGMDRQTLRDWVHRYNEAGIDGLTDRKRSGRPGCLSQIEQAKVAGWVEQGANLAKDGVVRFRRVDLRDRVAGRFGVYLHEGSVGRPLRGLGYRRLSVRTIHPKTDLEAQETFKKRARIGGPPVAVETGRAIVARSGAAECFLVDQSPSKNVVHGRLRTCMW